MIGLCSAKEDCLVNGCRKPNHYSLLYKPLKNSEKEMQPAVLQSTCSSKEEKRLSYLLVLQVKVKSGNKTLTTFVLLDTGSQHTYCSLKLADLLGFGGPECSMEMKTMCQVNKTRVCKGKIVYLILQAYDSETEINIRKVFVINLGVILES